MKFAAKKSTVLIAAMSLLWVGSSVAQTHFTNIGSIANTRHNLTQSTATVNPTVPAVFMEMDKARNDYGEICVYCHTPHAANTTLSAPLWNRTITSSTYSVYNSGSFRSGTLSQTVLQPGGSSLTCLSCHDGTVAIDSIINMPGSGRYNANQMRTGNTAAQKASAVFLDTWNNPGGRQDTISHLGLNSRTTSIVGTVIGDGQGSQGCIGCHSNPASLTALYTIPPDFTVFNIGTDLTNDHPVGITFPTVNGTGTGFNTPVPLGNMRYFDVNGNGALDKGDVRMYAAGLGGATGATSATVECASCHDPHGVPSAGPGSVFKPTFLRINNSGSALCLTCHIK